MRGFPFVLGCFVAALLLGGASRAAALDPTTLLGSANAAYQAGDYAGAAASYRQLVEGGFATSDLYFNLGTAALRAGRRGEAVLSFERALRLDPGDADVAWNLAEAEKGNIDKIVGVREEEPLVERVGARVPVELAGLVFLAAWVGGILLLMLRTRVGRLRGAFTLTGGLGVFAAVVAGLLLGAAAWHRQFATSAIVVAPVTAVREGPAADFKAAFEIHEGLKVRVVRRDHGFLRIRLPNGTEGWVSGQDVPTI